MTIISIRRLRDGWSVRIDNYTVYGFPSAQDAFNYALGDYMRCIYD